MTRPLGAGVAAAVVVAVVLPSAHRRWGRDSRWTRRNYRDREVTLLLGPACAAGALAGLAVAIGSATGGSRRRLLVDVGVVATSAAVGLYDDLAGDSHARGLRGHLRAAASGRLTTGMVKLAALGAGSLAGARLDVAVDPAASGSVLDWVPRAVTAAGVTNLVNLLDLRPGRALKVASMLALATLGQDTSGVALGCAAVALAPDLGERAMLGDGGAAVIGALVGRSVSHLGDARLAWGTAAAVVALTLSSERHSFSAVIAGHPLLRTLDELGRRPARSAPAG